MSLPKPLTTCKAATFTLDSFECMEMSKCEERSFFFLFQDLSLSLPRPKSVTLGGEGPPQTPLVLHQLHEQIQMNLLQHVYVGMRTAAEEERSVARSKAETEQQNNIFLHLQWMQQQQQLSTVRKRHKKAS